MELVHEPFLNFTCFRLDPGDMNNTESLNDLNEKFLEEINRGGKVFLTHTKIRGIYTLRMVIGQTYAERKHVDLALDQIRNAVERLMKETAE